MEELEMKFEMEFNELENKSRLQEGKLNEKHQSEMEELYNYLDMKLPKVVKFSKKYLDLKNQEENLAKQQKYKDAMLIKKQRENLEKVDKEKFNSEKTEKIKSQSIKTANKHLNEKNALRKKIELELDELKKKKIMMTNTLILKYKNRRSELELQQKAELHLCENNSKYKASK